MTKEDEQDKIVYDEEKGEGVGEGEEGNSLEKMFELLNRAGGPAKTTLSVS